MDSLTDWPFVAATLLSSSFSCHHTEMEITKCECIVTSVNLS